MREGERVAETWVGREGKRRVVEMSTAILAKEKFLFFFFNFFLPFCPSLLSSFFLKNKIIICYFILFYI